MDRMTDWDLEAWAAEATSLVRQERKAEEQRFQELQKKFDKDLNDLSAHRDPRDLFPRI